MTNQKKCGIIFLVDTREWLSGRASPCQGERREFESRLPLHQAEYRNIFSLFFIVTRFFGTIVLRCAYAFYERGVKAGR